MGRYGYFEAVDCTSARFHHEQPFEIVRSYMAHHQGMILTAIVNALIGRRDGGALPPRPARRDRRAPPLGARAARRSARPRAAGASRGTRRPRPDPARAEPWPVPARGRRAEPDAPLERSHVHARVVGGDRRELVARPRPHARRSGPDDPSPAASRSTYATRTRGACAAPRLQPCGSWPADGEVVFAPHKVEFHRRDDGIFLRTEVGVGPVEDVEIRRVRVSNETDRVRRLTVFSYAEVVLSRTGGGPPAPGLQQALRRSRGRGSRRGR